MGELPEFSHTSLESLRQPLEDKMVTISRVSGTVTYPASFMMVSAMNPCLCCYFSDPKKKCTCSSSAVSRYQKRVSGPLLDRIDVFVEVPSVEYEKLVDEALAQNSSYARQRVEQVREIQRERFKDNGFLCNSEMGRRKSGNRALWTKAPRPCSKQQPNDLTSPPEHSTGF